MYREIHELLRTGTKVIVHGEEVGDRIVGVMGGYIRWAGLIDDDTQAITVTERLAGRQLDPFARNAHPHRHQAALTPSGRTQSLLWGLGTGTAVSGRYGACKWPGGAYW